MYRGSQFFDKFRLHFTKRRVVKLIKQNFHYRPILLLEIGPGSNPLYQDLTYLGCTSHIDSEPAWSKFENHLRFPPASFNFSYAIHVVEHFNPKHTSHYFKTIAHLLSCDGIFYAITPNINSLPAKIFGKHWWFRLDSTHKQYFYPAKIAKMLHEAGFEHIKVKFPLMDSISSDITSILGCLPHKKPILSYFLVKITCICAIPLVILARLLFPSLRPTMEVVAQKERFPYADENFI